VNSAVALNDTVVEVVFSEALDIVTAINIANYTGLTTIATASLDANLNTVTLILSTPLVSAQIYNLTIDNVKDLSLNEMDSSQTFTIIYTVPIQTIFKVLLVDDDANGPDESSRIDTALSHSGYTYSVLNAGSTIPTYNDLKDYDMVIWTTANDGLDLNLWDVSDTTANGAGAVKFTSGLTQFLDSNGVVWIDGLDFMYDIYGSAPYDFNAGDFVYDKMGIDNYAAQSHVDDTLGTYSGLPMALKTANNTINSLDTVKWKWSSLYYGDAFDITSSATALYEMGPADYDFAGKTNALYKDNIITSSLRIGSLGDGSAYVQEDIDSLIISMVRAVDNGLPDNNAPIVNSATAISDSVINVVYNEKVDSTAENVNNYTGVGSIISATLMANNTEVNLLLSTPLVVTQVYNLTINNVKDEAQNVMDSAQTFAVVYIVPPADTIPPVVNDAKAISANMVEVFYNEPVDVSGENVANYSGLGAITSAVRNANGDVVTLTLTNSLIDGNNNTLTISNIKDTSNNIMPNAVSIDFVYNSTIADLVINEIMYNDITLEDSLEYFEIYNNSTLDANISGYEVTEGVEYTFPANTVIPSHGFIVIAKNADLINSVFNITGTHQWTSGGLKNSGEDIEIRNTVGDVIDYVDYDDASPWPVEADGDGYALELHSYSDDNNDGANWFTFNVYYGIYNGDTIFGTPGRDNIYDYIEENSALNSIRIYPNPATNRVNVDIEQGDFMVKIYSISGSLVKEVEISNSSSIISIESLETGIYMMMFVESKTGAVGYRKLIVNR